ncbi:MAG: class I SAM-dependent methyltransferase [Victivallales bacterium]|nr:class I SAM-dependent methyltransferase [Victivallales bacterium]
MSTIWNDIYKNYLAGGAPWGTITDELNPELVHYVRHAVFPLHRALDIGCGMGLYLQFLQQCGFETTGLDSSEAALAAAAKRLDHRGQLILADMYEYPLPEAAYDFILSHCVLHHGRKKQVAALLTQILAALVPGGKIFVSLPDAASMQHWSMMAEHEMLEDGTCLPVTGPEKGLPHSFYSREEIETLFAGYDELQLILNERETRWLITGTKR